MKPSELTWSKPPIVVDDAAVERVEAALGVALPLDYREFARVHQGGTPLESDFAIEDPRQRQASVGMFLTMALHGSDSVVGLRAILGDRLPATVVPVAADGGGDFVCLDLRAGSRAGVICWHHEREGLADEFTVIAPTFTEFVAKLYRPDVDAEALLD